MAEGETSRTPSPPPRLPLPALVESLLLVAAEPASVAHLARALGVTTAEIEGALELLVQDSRGRGIRLQRYQDTVQLISAPEAAEAVGRFLQMEHPAQLSAAALEVLAVVAYQGPITRAGIAAARGVDSDRLVAQLLARGLLEEVGHAQSLGHPALLCVTREFLHYFGSERLEPGPLLDGGDRT